MPSSVTQSPTPGPADRGDTLRHEKDVAHASAPGVLSKRVGITLETFVWKHIDGLDLCADIYYPAQTVRGSKIEAKRPIALIIHGGAHFLLTRRQVPMKHVKALLKRGFLPVSIDYRLCPELPLAEGSIPDAVDALAWVRETLPGLQRARSDVQIDCSRIMAGGWSSGGHLAMVLVYAAPERGIKPPDVVVSFYGMCDLESEFWTHPLKFMGLSAPLYTEDDLLGAVSDKPVAGTSPTVKAGTGRNPVDPNQSPRALLAIHCFSKAQMIPVLVNGLPTRAKAKALRAGGGPSIPKSWMALPQPPAQAVRPISPYAQILAGRYHTPTFLAHGDNDKELPIQQSRDAVAALRASGVEVGFAVARGAGHSFDFRPEEDPLGTGWAVAQEAYEWAAPFVGLCSAGN